MRGVGKYRIALPMSGPQLVLCTAALYKGCPHVRHPHLPQHRPRAIPYRRVPAPRPDAGAVCAALVCAGLYRRALARVAILRLAGEEAAGHGDDAPARRLPRLGHHRRHPRRPARLHTVLSAEPILRGPLHDSPALARRHVVPWRLYRRHHRADPVRAPPEDSVSRPLRHRDRSGADRPLPRPARQLREWRALWPADRRALGDGVPDRPGTGAAPPEPALRSRPRGRRALHHPVLVDAERPYPPPPWLRYRRVPRGLRARPHLRGVLPRARLLPRLPRRPHDHGPVAVAADADRRRLFHLARAARRAASGQVSPFT